MNYSFAKVIGMTNTTLNRPATAKWSPAELRRHLPVHVLRVCLPRFVHAGRRHDARAPNSCSTARSTATSCARDADTTGQSSNSKGFVEDGCVLTSLGGTLHDANGNSFTGTGCDSPDLDDYVGKDVLLPVWGSATGGGGGSDYTITNLVGFHVLGWSGNGSDRGGAIMTKRCTVGPAGAFTGDPTTLGDDNKPCLYGYVTSFVSTAGGTTGASCTTGALRSACYVYLDS